MNFVDNVTRSGPKRREFTFSRIPDVVTLGWRRRSIRYIDRSPCAISKQLAQRRGDRSVFFAIGALGENPATVVFPSHGAWKNSSLAMRLG